MSLDHVKRWCRKSLNMSRFENSDAWTKEARSQILEYFYETRQSFTFPLLHINTDFRKSVLKLVSEIPFGQTRSYSQIALALDKPGAIRAVGTANATNPLPIVIPCHRVLRSDGSLGGYGGGLEMKKFLLKLEWGNWQVS